MKPSQSAAGFTWNQHGMEVSFSPPHAATPPFVRPPRSVSEIKQELEECIAKRDEALEWKDGYVRSRVCCLLWEIRQSLTVDLACAKGAEQTVGTQRKNVGPAFPQSETINGNPMGSEHGHQVEGMSLLDWFAGKALPSLIPDGGGWADFAVERCAAEASRQAYQIASAMIAEKRRLEAQKEVPHVPS